MRLFQAQLLVPRLRARILQRPTRDVAHPERPHELETGQSRKLGGVPLTKGRVGGSLAGDLVLDHGVAEMVDDRGDGEDEGEHAQFPSGGGTAHLAGAAVDLSLCTVDEIELDLGTAVNDTATERSHTEDPAVDATARRHRAVLAQALRGAGLVNYPSAWWHWSYGDRYWAYLTGSAQALYGPILPDSIRIFRNPDPPAGVIYLAAVTLGGHDLLEFRLLGPVEALVGGRAVPLGGLKPQALLAALVLERGRVVSASRLVELLWRRGTARQRPIAHPDLRFQAAQGFRRPRCARRHRVQVAGLPGPPRRRPRRRRRARRPAGAKARQQSQVHGHDQAARLLAEAVALSRGPSLSGLQDTLLSGQARRLDELLVSVAEERFAAEQSLGRFGHLADPDRRGARTRSTNGCAGS